MDSQLFLATFSFVTQTPSFQIAWMPLFHPSTSKSCVTPSLACMLHYMYLSFYASRRSRTRATVKLCVCSSGNCSTVAIVLYYLDNYDYLHPLLPHIGPCTLVNFFLLCIIIIYAKYLLWYTVVVLTRAIYPPPLPHTGPWTVYFIIYSYRVLTRAWT